MHKTFTLLGTVAIAVVVAVGPALAQTSGATATKFSGTATGAGTVSRSIIDITQPNGPNSRQYGPFRVQANTTVNVPVTNGMTADQIGTALRDAINNNVTLQGLGYTSKHTTPSGTAVPSRIKLTRQVGSYNTVDNNTAPGVTMSASAFTVEDAPGLPPFGLGMLAAAFSGLVWWERRRRRPA